MMPVGQRSVASNHRQMAWKSIWKHVVTQKRSLSVWLREWVRVLMFDADGKVEAFVTENMMPIRH